MNCPSDVRNLAQLAVERRHHQDEVKRLSEEMKPLTKKVAFPITVVLDDETAVMLTKPSSYTALPQVTVSTICPL